LSVRILVVEDNRALAENIEELFAELGASVAICPRAEDVRRALERERFELAVVDVQLPGGVSGLELLPSIQASSPDGEVILATGNATLGSAIEAVRHGVFAYLQKPFAPQDLLTLAERALAQVALRRERALLAAELGRSEALHRAVVETVETLILGLDQEHRVRMWNRYAMEATGWSVEEVLGQKACELLLDPEDVGAFERALADAAAGVRADVQVPVRTRRGTRRIVRWRITLLRTDDGAAPLALAAGMDVTEKLELETRAAEAEALAAMGRLTAGLAHEVRNPLNAASLQLEILGRTARKLGEPGAREAILPRVEIVKSELGRLSRLLDEFLGLARPQHLAMCPVDVGAVVSEVVALQAPVAERSGIALVADVAPIGPAHGDAAKLKQALMNLVVNAIEAMSDVGGGTIVVGAGLRGGAIEVRVEDDGPGLPDLPKELLKPFVTTKAAGTGLGLAIVNRIVELHGGAMEIGPREGSGTRARFTLPLADERRARRREA
jgi:PAS domain S-box-containing protein